MFKCYLREKEKKKKAAEHYLHYLQSYMILAWGESSGKRQILTGKILGICGEQRGGRHEVHGVGGMGQEETASPSTCQSPPLPTHFMDLILR